ncbi:hypothetical protein AAHE18_08G189100 [Arachis hypogaea]
MTLLLAVHVVLLALDKCLFCPSSTVAPKVTRQCSLSSICVSNLKEELMVSLSMIHR